MLQCHAQMPTHEPLAVHWHSPKSSFLPSFSLYFFFPPVQEGEFPRAEGLGSSGGGSGGCGAAAAPRRARHPPAGLQPGWCSQSTLCCSAPSCQAALALPNPPRRRGGMLRSRAGSQPAPWALRANRASCAGGDGARGESRAASISDAANLLLPAPQDHLGKAGKSPRSLPGVWCEPSAPARPLSGNISDCPCYWSI